MCRARKWTQILHVDKIGKTNLLVLPRVGMVGGREASEALLFPPPSPNTKYKLMFVEEKFLKEEKGSARFSSFMNFS